MTRSLLIAVVLAAVLAGPAEAQPSLLMPGVTYEREVRFTLHGPVVIHVVATPRPTGLYALQPVLAKGTVQGRERLTVMQRRLASRATAVGVNGDLSQPNGRPQGLFLQDGVMQTQPLGTRSSLGIDARGSLSIERIPFFGDWRGLGPRRGLGGLNDQSGPNGTVLFTSAWAGATPAAGDAVEAVLPSLPAAKPNTDLTASVSQLLRGGGHGVPRGGAILYARGNAGTRLAAEAAVGTSVTVRAILPSPFSTAVSGIGGGPLLVKNRKAVFRANEVFGNPWLIQRTARTAVGQRADGSILLVVVEGGRPGSSVGMTNFELAQTMAGLGAVTAMGLDGGADAAMAFDGSLLSRPTQGEKPIGNAFALLYSGVYAPPVDDLRSAATGVTSLAYKLVRPSTVSAVLDGPGSAHMAIDSRERPAGVYSFPWRGLDSGGGAAAEGRWTWRVTATDDLGRRSEAERVFSFNTTLESLALDRAVLRGRSAVRITVDLARPASLNVRVERGGAVLRTLLKRQADAGKTTVSWNGRLGGKLSASRGSYLVRATATNQVGTTELTATVRRARR